MHTEEAVAILKLERRMTTRRSLKFVGQMCYELLYLYEENGKEEELSLGVTPYCHTNIQLNELYEFARDYCWDLYVYAGKSEQDLAQYLPRLCVRIFIIDSNKKIHTSEEMFNVSIDLGKQKNLHLTMLQQLFWRQSDDKEEKKDQKNDNKRSVEKIKQMMEEEEKQQINCLNDSRWTYLWFIFHNPPEKNNVCIDLLPFHSESFVSTNWIII
ncbi:hypothetical protein RFI_04307 [Reticulomyxa filosa]|uniref:Uncharacterized protein n=1 Tax=Reticulomyxa filosa TaxID=46433 RepID=X6P3N6_RETFI|nr:hypothetical protein RFI_04307 [Reticulomyxa filosa]|eukprot:ETO32811.1 hypothetical protein RFI_04307 [Reticulomyxa filosa]